MKHTVILAVFSILVFTSCRKNTIVGEGPIVTETRQLASFESVDADGSMDVEVYPSTTNKVEVSGYHNLVPVFETEVHNGRLRLKFRDRLFNVRHNNIKVVIYSTSIRSFSINGSGNAHLGTGLISSAMDLSINGSGDIHVEKNKFTNVHCNINGSGNIKGRQCETDHAKVDISGSGSVELSILKTLDVKISGSGDVFYWGDPAITDTDISGSGKIKKRS